MTAASARDPFTRFLVLVLIVVANRWFEMRVGWPDYVVLPVTALAGLALIDLVALPPGCRLGVRGWLIDIGAALGMGLLIFAVGAAR